VEKLGPTLFLFTPLYSPVGTLPKGIFSQKLLDLLFETTNWGLEKRKVASWKKNWTLTQKVGALKPKCKPPSKVSQNPGTLQERRRSYPKK